MRVPLPMLGEAQEEVIVANLHRLNGRLCKFEHEKGEGADPPQCRAHIQEITAGCGHAAASILLEAVCVLEKRGTFSPDQAASWKQNIRSQTHTLGGLDARAAWEYIEFETLSSDILLCQQRIIDERMKMKEELLSLLGS